MAQPDPRGEEHHGFSDDDLYGQVSSYAIEPNHPLIPRWPALRVDLITVLEQSPIQQRALEVYHRRRSFGPAVDEDTTTVMVVAEEGDNKAWSALERALRDKCCEHGLASLRVELVVGTVSRFSSRRLVTYETRPPMGSSLAVAQETHGGTLGGYLWLRHDGQSVLTAMTCHHVLRLAEEQGPVEKPDESLRVSQPALSDNEYTAERVGRLRAVVSDRARECEEKIACGFDTSLRREGLQLLRDQIATYERIQANARSDHDFGYAWATSGYRVAPTGCSLDWGLVRVKEGREGKNVLPPTVTSLEHHLAGQISGAVTETAEAQLFDEVVAMGKESGSVLGRFSSIKSDVWYPENGRLTTECVATPVGPGPFQGPGDSGAWLVNKDGRLVGLLFGGPAGKHCLGPGYFTPIAAVLSDIRARTGHEVSLDII